MKTRRHTHLQWEHCSYSHRGETGWTHLKNLKRSYQKMQQSHTRSVCRDVIITAEGCLLSCRQYTPWSILQPEGKILPRAATRGGGGHRWDEPDAEDNTTHCHTCANRKSYSKGDKAGVTGGWEGQRKGWEDVQQGTRRDRTSRGILVLPQHGGVTQSKQSRYISKQLEEYKVPNT